MDASTRIVESDHQGTAATTDFTYDRRNRLTEEYREGVHPYHLSYTYDMAGNRLTKVDATNETNEIVTQYVYDVDNESYPALFGSQNNRLMREKTFGASGTIEQRWYHYDLAGRVTYVVQKRSADVVDSVQWYRGTEIMYDHSGHVWMTRLTKWKLTPTQQYPDGIPDLGSIEYLAAMEYRYDAARARYLVRPREPHFMGLPQRRGGGDMYEAGTWHDYAGYEAGEDRRIDPGSSELLLWEDPLRSPGWQHSGERCHDPAGRPLAGRHEESPCYNREDARRSCGTHLAAGPAGDALRSRRRLAAEIAGCPVRLRCLEVGNPP